MRRALLAVALAGCAGPQPKKPAPLVDAGPPEIGASASATPDAGPKGPCGCDDYGKPEVLGKIGGELDEASGLATSRLHPGIVYTHNDSGDTARVFALREDATQVAEIALVGVKARDFEDIAVGPCPEGSCVYVADIGDNNKVRKSLVVHRFAEPKALAGKLAVNADPLRFKYPDGPHNAEALLVHPKTGELVVVTKVVIGAIGIYRFPTPLAPNVEVTLEHVGEVVGIDPLSQLVTAGAVSPCGDRLLLRTYGRLYEFTVTGSVAAALLGKPREVPAPDEAQGEAVTYRANGQGYLTTSEGLGAPLYGTRCATP
ncbi:MAG: hypothetical protein IPJ34_08400 [Myxococcales bacterium]|nr:hypothetical protein [Myxococcales bacterium]